LDSKLEDKRFYTEGFAEFLMLLISSWKEIQIVKFVAK
jgi:hypothetical protein